MPDIITEAQLSLNFDLRQIEESNTDIEVPFSEPICLQKVRSNNQRAVLITELERSGLLAWKQSKLEA